MTASRDAIQELQKRKHKAGVSSSDWAYVSKDLVMIALWVCQWADFHSVPIVFTSIIRGRVKGSKTDIHAAKRAFDLSVKGWSIDEIDDFLIDCNREFAKEHGAYSSFDQQPRAAIYEFNNGIAPLQALAYARQNENEPHLHIQVRP